MRNILLMHLWKVWQNLRWESLDSLMLRRVMLSKKEVEPIRKRNLYRTICKLGGKCCNVIMDSDSTNNLVLEEMVQNLGFKRLKHPCSYAISWFLNNQMMEVKEQYLVNFNNQPYRDEVLCNVLSMSACHDLFR